jgi:hypothetical protein
MPHKVEISDKTFERLKEYCSINDLKIGQYADKLIYDGLMIEMYGDVPFTNYRKPPQEIKQIPLPKEVIEKFPPEKFEEEYIQQPEPVTEETKFIEAPPIPEDVIERKKTLDKEFLENTGIPTKVVNKITKRRLK